MRHFIGSAVLFLTVGVATSEPLDGGGPPPPADVLEALSGIDFLPGANRLGGDSTTVGDIANGAGDIGVRLRAYRSLGLFNDPESREALTLGIERYRNATSGTDLLFLIAAAEGLGEIAGPADVAVLGPLLDAPSRDLRAVVARALGHVADASACNLLRRRRDVEQTEQVEIAIDEASAVCP